MTDEFEASYRHTQTGPWSGILLVFGAGLLGLAWFHRDETVVAVLLPSIGSIALVLAASFRHLTVNDEGDRLAIRFGPLPLFQKRIRYADMQAVEVGQTTWLDGWGIHMSMQGGWVWNIAGWDCVVVHHGGTTLVGTDDAANLARFLAAKIEPGS
ncbi:MAG: hypothetical protein U0746_18015 [Gemmataceae bacterium]